MIDSCRMLSSYSSQTSLKGQPFRAFEERWPAENRMRARLLRERPSAAEASKKLLRHWPSKIRRAPLTRRPA
ncbi:MAG TPA: hypothetical protein VFN75_00410 [Pseudonocardiaceae bacterium]|nr:hypothetical protein [Pseudonocardiaceae bacterium]